MSPYGRRWGGGARGASPQELHIFCTGTPHLLHRVIHRVIHSVINKVIHNTIYSIYS